MNETVNTTDSEQQQALKCPACKTQPLMPGRFGKSPVELDVCRKCRGIWFDRDEFHHVFQVGAMELRCEPEARPTRWKCPCCTRALRRTTYPQTETEVLMCIDCDGVWTKPEDILKIRRQRLLLRRKGTLKQYAPVTGRKGEWVRYVNDRIAALQKH